MSLAELDSKFRELKSELLNLRLNAINQRKATR